MGLDDATGFAESMGWGGSTGPEEAAAEDEAVREPLRRMEQRRDLRQMAAALI